MTSKQRAYLRGLANVLEPVLAVGKDGITPGVIASANEQLDAHELIKAVLTRGAPVDAREAVSALCQALDAEPVQVIGNRFSLYRPSKDNPRIDLPG